MEILRKAAIAQYNFEHHMLENCGYETQTTFYSDFTIADLFGDNAVLDTYNRAFTEFKTNIVYLTELSMVLNHKLWEHYHKKNETLTNLYDKLWKQIDEYCCENLKGDDLSYYLHTTD